jgi:hypothetical protein
MIAPTVTSPTEDTAMTLTIKALTSFAITASLVAPGCESDAGPSQLEVLEVALALVGPDTNERFMFCDGDGPSSLQQPGAGVLFMKPIDASQVHVEPHRGCEGLASVIQFEQRDANTRLITLAVPPISCPFPDASVGDEVWTATLELEATYVFMTVFSDENGIYRTKVNSVWNGEVTRTGSGSAICEYSYFFPGV